MRDVTLFAGNPRVTPSTNSSFIAEKPMTIEVQELEDGGIEITWDPDDPIECALNDWTAEMFMEAILEEANRVITEHEVQTQSDS